MFDKEVELLFCPSFLLVNSHPLKSVVLGNLTIVPALKPESPKLNHVSFKCSIAAHSKIGNRHPPHSSLLAD